MTHQIHTEEISKLVEHTKNVPAHRMQYDKHMELKNRIVATHLERWRALKAWGRSIDNVKIEISRRSFPERGGTCWTREQRLVVYQQPHIHDMLAVGLHEMAHAVEMADHHGTAWQQRFAMAVGEATGFHIPGGCEDDYHIMQRAAEDAVRQWWRRSGHGFAANLLLRGVKK